ncbi:MAG: sigma-54-dependent transcriptional regulator [Granulosicoccus sp.]
MNLSFQVADMQNEPTGEDTEFSRLLRSAAILVVDDEPGMRNFLKRALETRCALLEVAGSAEEAEALRLRYHFDVLLVDIRLPGLSGLDWLGKLRERGIRTHVIYMTAYADLDMAVGALRIGADDFIMKPFRTEQMIISIRRTLTRGQILRENSLLRLQLQQLQNDDGFIGQSEPVMQMLLQARQIASTSTCVLIEGEGGVGKRLLAKTIHSMSRRPGAFISVSCGALQSSTKDADLFGDEGLLVHANKGTLLLIDVEELSPSMQAMLVHVLEHGTLRSAGRSHERSIDVRVIATTSVNLPTVVGTGQFRSDLQYRLNALPLTVPPLRERGEDIKLLVDTFMLRITTQLRLAPVELLHEDWKKMSNYHWPGNVRELRNVVERAILLGRLPIDSFETNEVKKRWQGPGFPLDYDLEKVERAHIEAVLESLGNNKSAAARILGVSRKTLERKQALWYGDSDGI